MGAESVSAYVGLGSNLHQPKEQIDRAIPLLGKFPGTWISGISSLYQSAPIGVGPQSDFINAVVCLSTTVDPFKLLQLLLQLEADFGRVRASEGGNARTLDLDLLLHGTQIIDTFELILPHPRMHQRRFVLLPLLELAPGLEIPPHGDIEQLIETCEPQRVERLRD